MSRKSKDSSNLADRFHEKVFKIKLKGTQEVPNNNEFMKAIESEYAIKYLESLGIEPTKANIGLILKEHPLKECKFAAGWNNSGRVADTLTIIAGQKAKALAMDNKKTSLDMDDPQIDKKKLIADPKGAHQDHEVGIVRDRIIQEEKNESDRVFRLDYNIESIKHKYLYPFNENKQKKIYQNLTDDPTISYLPQVEKGVTNDVLNAFKYYFPFSHVKIPPLILKELQVPLKVTTLDIVTELKKFIDNFPFNAFPQEERKKQEKKPLNTYQTSADSRISEKDVPITKPLRGIVLKDLEIEKCKSFLITEELARIIGVLSHLSYWQIFGLLNPVQPDLLTKKQMILITVEQINILRRKVKNIRLWSMFYFPMILLTMRMMVEFLLRNNYYNFFELEKPGAIALEKANMLITKMFDPNMLYSRFIFFESEIEAVNKKFMDHLDETRFRSNRIYGTNPYLDLYFPRPESDFVRNIRQKKSLQKNRKIDQNELRDASKDNEREPNQTEESKENNEYLQQSYKVKMFQVLLDKIDHSSGTKYRTKSSVLNYDREKI